MDQTLEHDDELEEDELLIDVGGVPDEEITPLPAPSAPEVPEPRPAPISRGENPAFAGSATPTGFTGAAGEPSTAGQPEQRPQVWGDREQTAASLTGPFDAFPAEVKQVFYGAGSGPRGYAHAIIFERCDVDYAANNEPLAISNQPVESQPTPSGGDAMPWPVRHDQVGYHVTVGDIVTVLSGRDGKHWYMSDELPFVGMVVDSDATGADTTEKWCAKAGNRTVKVQRFGLSIDPGTQNYKNDGVTLTALQDANSAAVTYSGVRPICPAGTQHGLRVGDSTVVQRRGRYMVCSAAREQFIGKVTEQSPVGGGTFCNYELREQDATATYAADNNYSLALANRPLPVTGQTGKSGRVIVAYNFAEDAGDDGIDVGAMVLVTMFASAVSTREPLYIIDRVIGTGDGNGGKSAIELLAGQYRALFCTEAPEWRFEDVMRVELAGTYTEARADGLYMQSVVLNTIQVVGFSCNRLPPGPVAVRWENPHVVIECADAPREPIVVTVKLSGLARGALGRFPVRSQEEHDQNKRRWRYMNGFV